MPDVTLARKAGIDLAALAPWVALESS